jgi:hypothetical protein
MPTHDPEQHNSPAYWQRRAEETRQLAGKLTDPVAKQAVLEIARSYEELAGMAAKTPLRQPSS